MRSFILSLLGIPLLAGTLTAAPQAIRPPLRFEENRGQIDASGAFVARTRNYQVVLSAHGATWQMTDAHLEMLLVDSNPHAAMSGLQPSQARVSYFRGADAAAWLTGVCSFRQVRVTDIYPGIDLVYYDHRGHLEHDFIVAPGATPEMIRLRFSGLEGLQIENDGDLRLLVGTGELRFLKPVAWQEIDGHRHPVDADFQLLGPAEIGFTVAAYDPRHALVIDPLLAYSSYLGGSGADVGNRVRRDAAGNLYLVGTTNSKDFPMANAWQSERQGEADVFVMKFDPTGTNLIFATYLGGSKDDFGEALAVDAAGNVAVGGTTLSGNFPVFQAFQDKRQGAADGFVTVIDASGTNLIYSTYLGGKSDETIFGLAVDASDCVYVTGKTDSSDFPTLQAFQNNLRGSSDAFVAKLAPDGLSLLYATYLGGRNIESGNDLVVDATGHAYVTGLTTSDNFPRTPDAFQRNLRGLQDAFVSKLATDGSDLVYSTLLGGGGLTGIEVGTEIALASDGCAVVTGFTDSNGFPTEQAYQSSIRGRVDAFLTKVGMEGTNLVFSTYLGGGNDEVAEALTAGPDGTILIAGWTASKDFPLVDEFQSKLKGAADVFVACFDGSGSNLVYATLLGGKLDDIALGMTTDSATNVYVTGYSASKDFPLVDPFQAEFQKPSDVFLAVIDPTILHDLAVTKLKAPKKVSFDGAPVASQATVVIQNRSGHDEIIHDLAMLQDLVMLTVESLGGCPDALVSVVPPKSFPVRLRARKSLKITFTVTFNCANDLGAGAGHEDYRSSAIVNHAALDGEADAHTACDVCPRPPLPDGVDPFPDGRLKDKGCGAKDPVTKQLGAEVLTDLVGK